MLAPRRSSVLPYPPAGNGAPPPAAAGTGQAATRAEGGFF